MWAQLKSVLELRESVGSLISCLPHTFTNKHKEKCPSVVSQRCCVFETR